MDTTDTTPAAGSRWGALRHRGYRLFWLARFSATFAALVVSVAVGWQVYDLTRNPLDLGFVGLVQFAPSLLLVLISGEAADRFNRRLWLGSAIRWRGNRQRRCRRRCGRDRH